MYPNLKLQLWKMGMRQNRLAKSLGMDETMLSKIVNGFREPSDQVRQRIALLLHSDQAWLFDKSSGAEGPENPAEIDATKSQAPAAGRTVFNKQE